MTATETNATDAQRVVAYTITFDRIGRTHNPEPVTFVDVDDPRQLAELIDYHARPFLFSRGVLIEVNHEEMKGRIICGFRSGGTFTIAKSEWTPGEPFRHPELGLMPGYVAGRCGHRVAESEWAAGFRTCERCPSEAAS